MRTSTRQSFVRVSHRVSSSTRAPVRPRHPFAEDPFAIVTDRARARSLSLAVSPSRRLAVSIAPLVDCVSRSTSPPRRACSVRRVGVCRAHFSGRGQNARETDEWASSAHVDARLDVARDDIVSNARRRARFLAPRRARARARDASVGRETTRDDSSRGGRVRAPRARRARRRVRARDDAGDGGDDRTDRVVVVVASSRVERDGGWTRTRRGAGPGRRVARGETGVANRVERHA